MGTTDTQTRDSVALLVAIAAIECDTIRGEVERLRSQAGAYVWGWQDAGGDEKDSAVSWEFGTAYGWHAYDFATHRQCFRMPFQTAFKQWRATGAITG